MKATLKLLFITVLGLFLLTGCRTATLYNVSDSPIEVKKGTSEEQVYKAIKNAGSSLGWMITKVKPGLAQGQLNIRKHMAIVDISYNTTSYSINYRNSSQLDYNAQKNTIHQNYNGWVQNLDNAIKIQLNNLAD
ncbi:hypothetical protein N5912_08950 [Arcobacter lacus]|uniref:hypothetical protein n=1 Tax=Arcobacter lacus TaxID=1912876 RepID=UPI0021BB2C6E|nr:hypothetical protein [Arcobacter lacus]MCT7911958.1 hypothetical protein [Arcobacter lacus]